MIHEFQLSPCECLLSLDLKEFNEGGVTMYTLYGREFHTLSTRLENTLVWLSPLELYFMIFSWVLYHIIKFACHLDDHTLYDHSPKPVQRRLPKNGQNF